MSVSIEKIAASPDAKSGEVVLEIKLTARVKAEDALIWARKVEIAASEALGVSA